MKHLAIGLFAAAAVSAAATIAATPAQAQGGPIVIVARNAFPVGSGCRVLFVMRNRSGRYIQGARIWLRSADTNLESFYISDRRPAVTETFEGSTCRAIRAGLYITRARCNFRGVLGRRNCAYMVRLINRTHRGGRPPRPRY